MCGIFAYLGRDNNAASIILEGLKRLEYRGYDSWGVAVKHPLTEKFVIWKRVGKIGNASVTTLPKATIGIGHTRWATHGGVTVRNTHPHLDCSGNLALVHNGIIENYGTLKQQLLRKGHRFMSETDSEVAVHLIEELEKTLSFKPAVSQAFHKLSGLNAIIVLNAKQETCVAIRSGSPLVVGFGSEQNYLASDAVALLPHTRKVYFLREKELVTVRENLIEVGEGRTGKKHHITPQWITWKTNEAEKGNYPHFMIKEIEEQPNTIQKIATTNLSQANRIADMIRKSSGTTLVGCGSAAYACIAGSYFFSKIAKLHVNWVLGSEFGAQLKLLTNKSLVIALSQSGETMDTLEVVRKAKENKAKVACIVNVVGSTLYRFADEKLLINAGPEKAVASTKAFTGKLANLLLTAYILVGKSKQGIKHLMRTAHICRTIINPQTRKKLKKIAQQLRKHKHIYVIGRGISYPAALEIALKIKEISYIHAEGFAAGELKHGVIALIDRGTPCIVILPKDETYAATLAGAMEVKARGGYIIGISGHNHEIFDRFIKVEDIKEASIIPNVVIGQLLAYELAVSLGYDPDMPRNLAKSVTVK